MNKIYIVSHYDNIMNVFMTKEKAEEYIKLLSNPMNILYDTDYTIDEYEPKDDCLNEEYYSVEATVYTDRNMKKTLDSVSVYLRNGADMDAYGNDGDISFYYTKRNSCEKDMYYVFRLQARFPKTNDSSVEEIEDCYLEMANKAFEKYVELIEQGTTSKAALRAINEELEEEI